MEKKINKFAPYGTLEGGEKVENGGRGSGNFGHAGRPGEVGGSASGYGSSKQARRVKKIEDSKALKAEEDRRMKEEMDKDLAEFRAEQKKEYDRIAKLPKLEGKTKLTDAIKQKGLDKYGMSDEELVSRLSEDYLGSDYIADDFLEDVQYYIDRIRAEDKALMRAAKEEFGFNSATQKVENGGRGSGNFGHAGRPGEVGGSAPQGSGGAVSTSLVSKGTMLRDHIDMDGQYVSDEHKMLCDIADSLYNADIGPEHFKAEYKELYEKYGKEYFDKVVEEMGSIDSATDTTEQASKLLESYKQEAHPEKSEPVKGGTKNEKARIKSLLDDYMSGDERGFKGLLEDVEAIGLPKDTNYQKAIRWIEGGGAAISYYDAFQDLKSIYGDNFKPETYLTKGGSEENGDWKYRNDEAYVWTIYKAKLAQVIEKEMEKQGNSIDNFYEILDKKLNRLEKALNGGAGSGNYGHAGRPGERGGSAPTSTASQGRGALRKGIADRVRETGGFTVNTQAEFYDIGKTKGYSVGGQGTERSLSLNDWNDYKKRNKAIEDFLKENVNVFYADPDHACLGGWVDNGKVYLDVSRVYKNKRQATRAAMKTDQDAIFDFKTGESPRLKDLTKEFGLEEEAKQYKGIRAEERKKNQ